MYIYIRGIRLLLHICSGPMGYGLYRVDTYYHPLNFFLSFPHLSLFARFARQKVSSWRCTLGSTCRICFCGTARGRCPESFSMGWG